MFLQKLKNIFLSIQNNDISQAEKYAIELRNVIYSIQEGGNHVFDQTLRKDIEPMLKNLGIHEKYINLLITIIKFMIDYVEKLKMEDIEKLSGILKEMRDILQQRLDKEMS